MAYIEKTEDWPTWNSMSTPKLMERMGALYETSKWHDCVFKLLKSDGNGEELVFAHSVVLASSSPVFEALCFGPMAEESPIFVPDIDPFAFRLMIKFIYTDCIDFTSVEAACNVLYASKKYLIYTLAGLAISYISHHINESNCLQIHEFGKFVHEERLVKESYSYLRSHLDDVLKYFSNECLSKDMIKSLVNEEELNGGELVLFKICLLWAEAECKQKNVEASGNNLRKVLIELNVLNKIRFLTFTQKEFEDEAINSGIFKKDEIEFIKTTINSIDQIKIMCSASVDNSDEKYNPSDFKTQKINTVQDSAFAIIQKILNDNNIFPNRISNIVEARKKIPLKRMYCHRFIEREMRPNVALQNGLKICTIVTANQSVRLTAIFCNAKILPIAQLNPIYTHTCIIERDYKEKVYVTITDCNHKVLFSIFYSEIVKYGTIFKIPLQSPVILERLQEYRIQVDLLNSVENYMFGVRNSISKFPSGLCVTFKEEACFANHDRFIEVNDLSIISALEICL